MKNTEEKKFAVRCRAVIVHEGKLLVVKHNHGLDFYALPGGHMEWGENIEDAMKREIFEEFGIEPQIGRLLYIHNFIEKETKQSIEFFFEITNSRDYLDIKKLKGTHSHELSEIRWINLHDDIKLLPPQILSNFKSNSLLSISKNYPKFLNF
ncbi:MAG: NUDIX domain-containing protein [Candidatus Nomurabacteria bacterium]|nr:NUDIX domain-containing protein [Candidatus Nomurabacteria bacterium]